MSYKPVRLYTCQARVSLLLPILLISGHSIILIQLLRLETRNLCLIPSFPLSLHVIHHQVRSIYCYLQNTYRISSPGLPTALIKVSTPSSLDALIITSCPYFFCPTHPPIYSYSIQAITRCKLDHITLLKHFSGFHCASNKVQSWPGRSYMIWSYLPL